ncbi:MAG: glycosyltransferase family 4 protein [Flectobacillus sp.]|uniref:glycosyltransferase family 4 protein n=1 Tax=Flectobacillus sp. TaxID=50419 RepID=UPI003B99CE4C
MRVLIIHNVLWAHYKSLVFEELFKISQKDENFKLLVVQIAVTERSRVSMGSLDRSTIAYPYELIQDGILEEVPLKKRITGMLSAIQRFKPDVVNITGYYDLAFWVVLFYCKLNGIKTILSNESTAGDHQRKGFKEKLKAFFVRQFDGFFNFGTLSAKYMTELGARPHQLLVNKNCVDNQSIRSIYKNAYLNREQSQINQNLHQHNFIFVGRLIPFKNLPVLMEAFQEALAQTKARNWGLILLGDGEQKVELEKIVSENGFKQITFLPSVGWKEVPTYLALADVLVLPSYSEPWGLVVNEAMACGMPVIVSERCGCAPDLVQNQRNGIIINPYSGKELANALASFMDGSYSIHDMGRVSEKIIEEYTPQIVAKEMYEGFKRSSQAKGK